MTFIVAGDSHIGLFRDNPMFTLRDLGAATAYHLKDVHSTNDTRRKLWEIINGMNKASGILILVLGELDCRIHIYYQAVKHHDRRSILWFIDETVKQYGKALRELKKLHVRFIVCGIPPPGFQPNLYKYEHYPTPEIQRGIYRAFNGALKTHCELNGIPYLDIYSRTVGEHGHMRPEYSGDDYSVHLNLKAQPIIIQLLGEVLK